MVDNSFLFHLRATGKFGDPISQETQTKAAQHVGQKNLTELEGLSVHGAQLTKLLLGLGRIFGVMAAEAEGHTPELTQFEIADEHLSEAAEALIRSAVMNLALVRYPGTKPGGDSDTKEYDYAIHPIFAPYFEFSYRRKRKMRLWGSDLIDLVRQPRQTIPKLLATQKRSTSAFLPDQLILFESYYNEDGATTAIDNSGS